MYHHGTRQETSRSSTSRPSPVARVAVEPLECRRLLANEIELLTTAGSWVAADAATTAQKEFAVDQGGVHFKVNAAVLGESTGAAGTFRTLHSKWEWRITDANDTLIRALPGFNGAHAFDQSGTYKIRLFITDPGEAPSSAPNDEVTVTVGAPTWAKQIYVANNGVDDDSTGRGTMNLPYKTLSFAAGRVIDGTRIVLRRGDTITDTGTANLGNRKNVLITSVLTTSEQDFAVGTADPVVQWQSGLTADYAIKIGETGRNVTVEGATFQTTEHDNFLGPDAQGGTANVVLRNATINGFTGIINGGGEGVLAQNVSSSHYNHLFYIKAAGEGWTALDSELLNSHSATTRVHGDYVLFHGNVVSAMAQEDTLKTQGGRFHYYSQNTVTAGHAKFGRNEGEIGLADPSDIVVDGNVYTNPDTVAYRVLGGVDRMMFRNNVVVTGSIAFTVDMHVQHRSDRDKDGIIEADEIMERVSTDLFFLNNTVRNPAGYEGRVLELYGSDKSFTVEGSTSSQVVFRNNLYDAPLLLPASKSFAAGIRVRSIPDLRNFRHIGDNVWPDDHDATTTDPILHLVNDIRVSRSTWNSYSQVGTDDSADVAVDPVSYEPGSAVARTAALLAAGMAIDYHGNARPNGTWTAGAVEMLTAPTGLTATAVSGTQVNLTWTDTASAETGFDIDRSTTANFAAGTVTTISLGGANLTSYSDTGRTANTTYHYRVRAVNTTSGVEGESASSDPDDATTPSEPVTGAYTSAEIGSPAPSGSTVVVTEGRDYDVTAGGSDIWGASDDFRFVYRQLTDDFDYKVRVQSLTALDKYTMAGLMARTSLDANSANVYLRVRPDADQVTDPMSLMLSARTTAGAQTTYIAGGTPSSLPDQWIRLKRSGDEVIGLRSGDGLNWTEVGRYTVATLGNTVYFGMAVNAHNSGTSATTTAEFRDLTDLSQPVTGPIRINFQADGSPLVAGYEPDYGDVYASRNGYTYGWSSDQTDVDRDRNINSNQLLDTLMHVRTGVNWSIDVPNGWYDVKVSIGDAQYLSIHSINVNGVTYWDNVTLDANVFDQKTVRVQVTNGKITLDSGTAPDKTTRLNYVEITRVIGVNFQADGSPLVAGYESDYGDVYASRNGYTYGWSIDHTDVDRDRNINSDQLLDTLMHVKAGANWSIDVPNGEYDVKVSIGDAQYFSEHTINVNGVNYWDTIGLNANVFQQQTRRITVTNGKITLDSGSASDRVTRLNYLEIRPVAI